jgi:hypothetical protein
MVMNARPSCVPILLALSANDAFVGGNSVAPTKSSKKREQTFGNIALGQRREHRSKWILEVQR